MPDVDKGGLKGETAKELWLGPVEIQRQREAHRRMRKELPDMERSFAEPFVPWRSLGVAPTAEQIDERAYGPTA